MIILHAHHHTSISSSALNAGVTWPRRCRMLPNLDSRFTVCVNRMPTFIQARLLSPCIWVLLLLLLTPWHCRAHSLQVADIPSIASTPKPTVTIINCCPYHNEILLGTVSAVMELHYDVIVYAYLSKNIYGNRVRAATALLHKKYGQFPVNSCLGLVEPRHTVHNTSGIIYVSGQEEVLFHRPLFDAAILRIKPRSVLAIIHNTGRNDLSLGIARAHPSVCLLALAKSPFQRLAHVLRPTPTSVRLGWILPTLPLGDGDTCLSPAADCFAVFTVQGNLHSARRDFPSLMTDMQRLLAIPAASSIRLKLIGAAKDPPAVPRDITSRVDIHLNLDFFPFYEEVQRSIALIPALASTHYLDGTKITSTVVTSLITGVPIIARPEFIKAYNFMPASAFFRQAPNESLAQAMLRVAAMTREQHLAVRTSLLRTRRELQAHNMRVIQRQLTF